MFFYRLLKQTVSLGEIITYLILLTKKKKKAHRIVSSGEKKI